MTVHIAKANGARLYCRPNIEVEIAAVDVVLRAGPDFLV